MNDTLEAIRFIVLACLLILIFLFGIGAGANFFAKKSCYVTYAEYQPQYGFWTDCRIMWHGKLTPVDMIKKVDIN